MNVLVEAAWFHVMGNVLSINLLKTVIGSGFARGYILIVELILLLVTSTLLSPEDRGFYIAAIALLKSVTVLSSFSLGQVAIYSVSTAIDRKKQLGKEAASMLLGGILFSVCGFLAFLFLGWANRDFYDKYVADFWHVMLWGLPVFLFEVYGYALLSCAGRIPSANISILVGKTFTWAGVVFSGYLLSDLSAPQIVNYVILGQLIIAIGYFYVLREEFSTSSISLSFSISAFIKSLASSIKLYPTIVATVFFGGVDVLFVYNYLGSREASTYQIAVQGMASLSVLPFAVAQYGYSIVTQNGADKGWLKYRRLFYVAFFCHVLLSVLSIPFVFLFNDLVLDAKYPSLIGVYGLMVIGAPGLYLSLTLAPLWISRGLFMTSSMLSCVNALLLILLAPIFLKTWGLPGAALVFLIGQLVSVITNGALVFYCEKKGAKYARE